MPKEELARDPRCPPCRKRKGKRKERTECWKGSYRELASGLIKHRREKIPCETSSPKVPKSRRELMSRARSELTRRARAQFSKFFGP